MAQPTFRDAQVGPLLASPNFATRVAVQVDFGTSGNAGVLVQANANTFPDTIDSITIGGTLSGGTTDGTVGVAGTSNVEGTISGGTALTLEAPVTAVQLGGGGPMRAGRAAGVTLTGVHWVQVTCSAGNAKPSLTVVTFDNVASIAAGVAISHNGTAFNQSVTTTTNDVAVALMYLDASNASTLTVTGPAVQRVRGAQNRTNGYQSLVWESAGLASSTTIAGTAGSGTGWQGTKWAVTGSVVPTATLSGSLDTIIGNLVAGASAITADLNSPLDTITGNLAVGGATGRLTSVLPLRDAARVVLANRSDVCVSVQAKPGLAPVALFGAQSITSGIWSAAGPFAPGARYNVLYEVGGEPIGCEIITATAP